MLGAGQAFAQEPVTKQPVRMTFLVPAGAQVWIEGAATRMRGPVREFMSPAMAPGQSYIYTVRVRWQEEGQVVDQTRDVAVKAGDFVELNFRNPAGGYVANPMIGFGERAFYSPAEEGPAFVPSGAVIFTPNPRWLSYYGDTPGSGTTDTTGAGG